MEKAGTGWDEPGGEGGGDGGGGGERIPEEDPRFDDLVDKMNKQNQLGGEDQEDPEKPGTLAAKKKHVAVAPPAPAVNHSAPLGSKTNPIVVPNKRGSQY